MSVKSVEINQSGEKKMFWNKIKSAEFKELDKKFTELEAKVKEYHRKVEVLDVDMSLFWGKLNKAINTRAIKKQQETETTETKDLNDSVLLPDVYGNSATNLSRKK